MVRAKLLFETVLPTTVLTALVKKGFVKLGNFKQSPRKGQYAYLLTPSGIREKSLLNHSFIKRQLQGFEDLRVEIQALEEDVGIGEATAAIQSGRSKRDRF
jgi:hypothetical protein